MPFITIIYGDARLVKHIDHDEEINIQVVDEELISVARINEDGKVTEYDEMNPTEVV